MNLLLACLCAVLSTLPQISAIGTYTVLSPKVLRSNRDFTVVVSDHAGATSTRITVEVKGSRVGSFVSREVVELLPDTTETFKFEVGELEPGDYYLTVTGLGGHNFVNTTQLQYESKSYSVFIQTDRPVYKPSGVIKFRVVVVNPLLKPSVTGAIDVYAKDGNGNIVKQWLRVFTNKGVFSDEVQLSDAPVLGNWQIIAEVLKQQTAATVMVAVYVLPKFEVDVNLPEYVTFDDEQIVATVEARYAHGRPVVGEVTLQVAPTYKYAYLQAPYDQPISVVKHIKGKTAFTLNIFDDLGMKEDYIRELQFTAYVKEELTDRVQNSSSTITVFRYPYKMELIRTSDSFKPGLAYRATLKVFNQDDTPLREGRVTVRHTFSNNRNNFTETQHDIVGNGIIRLVFYPPLDDITYNLAIEAQLGNLTQWLADISRAQSPSNSFLQATISGNPMVGEEAEVGINATEPMSNYVFEIIGRGDIIFAQTLKIRDKMEHTFRFLASVAMAPRARIVVYYVRPDGEVVADSLHFSVEGGIQNEVTLSVNPINVDAGQDVSITVTAKPNSFVAISAIDQTSSLLGGGNFITEAVILKELDSYDPGSANNSASRTFPSQRFNQHFDSRGGTIAAAEIFEHSGFIFMSNGHVPQFNINAGGFIPGGHGPVDGTLTNQLRNRIPASNGTLGRPVAALNANIVNPDLGPGIDFNSPTRPPLAGPYAFSYLPSPPDDNPRIYLSKDIPEPWIFHDTRTRLNGVVTLRERVPDSITSYLISAFAVDDFYGLGVAHPDKRLTVSRSFFVSVHVPSPVLKGEAVAVEAVVFNYGTKPITANVTLFNSGDFLFPHFGNELDQGSPSPSRSRSVDVQPESSSPLSFMIVPQKMGVSEVRVSAVTPNTFYTTKKQLIVKAEGETLTRTKAVLVDLSSNSSFSEDVNITTPNNIVKDSLEISVSVVGDIIGPVSENADNLLQLPTGCGEQNLAKLMSNVILLDYLTKQGPVSEKTRSMAVQNMELGFQRQLTFRHNDGSFSAFGEKDSSGSTWLTAFIVRSLPLLQNYITVEPELILNASIWLIDNQEFHGSFKEKGVVNNVALQDKSGNGAPLTAYVLIALLNIQGNLADGRIEGLRNSINRGLEYLSSQFDTMDDAYSLALSAYTFQIANHPLKDSAFYNLEAKALIDGDKKWWSDQPLRRTIETVANSSSLDVETTSYALLTYNLRGAVTDSLHLVKWLISQRNEEGGFHSSQDTLLGIMSLTAISASMQTSKPRMEIRLIYGDRGDRTLLRPDNFNVPQKLEIPSETRLITVKARGAGHAVVRVTYKFNVMVTGPSPAFSLDPQLDGTTDKNRLRLTSCTGYTAGNQSNMAVLDVSLPTGYVLDNDLIYSLYNYDRVKKVEKKPDGLGVFVYFDYLTPAEVCPTITAYRVSKIAFQKKVPVKIYDYYNPSLQARQFYSPSATTLCDICDLDECDKQQCEVQIVELNRQFQDESANFLYPVGIEDGSASNIGGLFLICLTSIITLARLLF